MQGGISETQGNHRNVRRGSKGCRACRRSVSSGSESSRTITLGAVDVVLLLLCRSSKDATTYETIERKTTNEALFSTTTCIPSYDHRGQQYRQLETNQFMRVNDYLISPSSKYYALLQNDGNFVINEGTPDNPGKNHWRSLNHQDGEPGKDFFTLMQNDGNFATYYGVSPSSKNILFNSVISKPTTTTDIGNYVIRLDDDSVLKIYKVDLQGKRTLILNSPNKPFKCKVNNGCVTKSAIINN